MGWLLHANSTTPLSVEASSACDFILRISVLRVDKDALATNAPVIRSQFKLEAGSKSSLVQGEPTGKSAHLHQRRFYNELGGR